MTRKDNPEVFNLPGYHPITGKHRDGKRGGGIAVYIAESLQYSEVRTVTELESLTVEIALHKRVLGLICVVYRTPQPQVQSFLNQLELLLLQHDSKKDLILCGDFNINVSCPDKSASSYIDFLGSYGVYVLNNLPTRETPSSKSCIDHISIKNMTSTVTLLNKISDYYIVLAELPASFQSKSTTSFETIEARNYSVFSNEETHLKYLFLLDQKLKCAMTIDINETLESISKIVLETFERFAPLAVISVTRYRKTVNTEISKQFRKPDKLFHRYLKHPSPENKKAYVSIRNEVTKSIRTSKRQELKKEIGSKPTSKQFFDSLRQKMTQMKNDLPIEIDQHHLDQFKTSSEEFTNSMNDCPTMMFCFPASDSEILKIISSLENKVNSSIDGIINRILNISAKVLVPYLTNIFNSMTDSGVFPSCLKVATITPLWKTGEKTDPDNYRPISILSSVSKVFERLLFNRISHFIETTNQLLKNQFGFRSKRSCVHAIAEITEEMRKGLDARKEVFACFMDLSKAFDIVDLQILLYKIEKNGLRGKVFEILKNYLKDRFQYINIGSKTSEMKPVNCGALLFLLFINDLPKNAEKSKIILFADNTNFTTVGIDCTSDFSFDIDKTAKWFESNKLTLSTKKSHFMNHGKPMLNSIELLGDTMSPNDSCKNLGVILDKKLNFIEHVDTICKKVSKFCGLIYRIRHYYSRKILLRFYFSFDQSEIQHGILVYGCSNKTSLHPIYQAQKRIVRAMFFMKNCDSVSGHFRKFNLLTVYELHIQSLLRQYFEERTGNSPSFFLKAELPEQHIMKIRRTKLNCLMLKITRTLIMRNSLETRLLRIHNWLMTNNLIPDGLNSLNLRQKLAEFTQLYIADNQVLH